MEVISCSKEAADDLTEVVGSNNPPCPFHLLRGNYGIKSALF
ncbi:MAG TPA: hypothetical protein VHG34_04800 [Nitrososphaeraceae archaeon]|nr:hypothetical protein [Nitrososphaeraceae archaeon]